MELIKGQAAIGKSIVIIGKMGKKLDSLVHKTACSCIMHAVETGDISLTNRLIDSLPQSARRKALVVWLKDFGPFVDHQDRKGYVFLRKDRQHNIDEAILTPFWTYTVEKEPEAFDLQKALESLIKRASSAAVRGEVDEQAVETLKETALFLKAQVEVKEEETA